MKKNIFAPAILLVGCSLMANAGSHNSSIWEKTPITIQGEKTKIKPEELPEAVKKTLAGDDYKGWEVANAYVSKEVYEVELKKGTEMKTFKFDKEGKLTK